MTEKAIKNISLLTDWYQYLLLKKTSLEIKTITGTLPLTFTAKGGNAVDWTIYGNNEIGKNLFEITAASTTISGVTFTVDKTAGTITVNGTATAKADFTFSTSLFDAGTYILSGVSGGSSSTYYMSVRIGGSYTVSNRLYDGEKTYTPSTQMTDFALTVANGTTVNNLVFKPMLRLADTSPEFEPYQIGVGERTKNLLEINETSVTNNGVTFTVDKSAGTIATSGTATGGSAIFKIYIDTALYGNFFFAGCANGGTSSTFYIDAYDETTGAKCKAWDGISNSVNCYNTEQRRQMQIPENHICCLRIIFARNVNADGYVFMPMILDDEATQDTLIPYGYEIPLTVSQGQTDKSYDIFVGNAPLTEGETVSETSTGIDIELFEGENTVSTTLTNKPEMTIKYK